MNNTNKGKTIYWVLGFGVAAYGVYYLYFSKSAKANTIIKTGNFSSGKSALMDFGNNFLTPWARAAKNGEPTFMFQGKAYNTNGGRAKSGGSASFDGDGVGFSGASPIRRSISSSRKKSHISSGRKRYSGKSTGWD